MKIYIVADMEGIAGVVSPDQIYGREAWDTERIRRQFTDEICAVCLAAKESGVEEIYVNDFHGNGRNIIPDKLPPEVFIIQGDFRSTSGFDLLDNTFGGLIIIGAHARTGTKESILPHTYSSKMILEVFGQEVGEVDILSLLAGEYKVPTLMISGDSKTMEQVRTNFPSTSTVVTKYSLGPKAALCFNPLQVLENLKEETKRAIKNASNIEPPSMMPPIPLKIRLNSVENAERISWIPQIKQLSDLVFEFQGENMKQIMKVIYGITLLLEG